MTKEEAAKEYGESFKTGEWFEKLRIEAFLAGVEWVEQKKDSIKDGDWELDR